jgi:2-iminobutanoate/2-iminopropanoate deaminase
MKYIAFAAAMIMGGHAMAQNADTVEFLNNPDMDLGFPFSEAVRVGNILYLSGNIGTVPGADILVEGGIVAEAHQTMQNIKSVAERYGSSMPEIVKCTVFLADIAEWPAFNDVYRSYFDAPYPARSAFAASGLALNARVEVECIATVGLATVEQESVD